MKATVNALGLPSFRQGGAGFYTATLLDGLAADARVDVGAIGTRRLQEELAELAPGVEVAVARPREPSKPAKAANYLLAARSPVRLDLGYAHRTAPPADVTHWPISFMHAPVAAGSRHVLTVLDLQHEVHPEFFSRTDLALRKLRWRPSARAADHVLTISTFCAEMLVDRYDLAPEDVTVSLLTARSAFLGPSSGDVDVPGLPVGVPWFVYPASPLGAKNHGRLLEALAIRRRRGSEAVLVLVGPTMHDWSSVERQIGELGLEEAVVRLGHVPDSGLRSIYERCTGLVFPSLFEGFGLPVLEAMAVGAPVATSAAGSLPEVAGTAARTFDPLDPEAIADGLAWLEGLSAAERAAVVEAGHRQAARFTPEAMVDATVAGYERALAS